MNHHIWVTCLLPIHMLPDRQKPITTRSMTYYEEAYAWDNNLLDKRRDQILEKSREESSVP